MTAGELGTGQQELRRSCLPLEMGQVLAFVKVKWYLDKKCSTCAYDISDFTSGDNDKTRKNALGPRSPNAICTGAGILSVFKDKSRKSSALTLLIHFSLRNRQLYDYGTVLRNLAVTFCLQRQHIDMCSEGMLAC